MAFFNLPSPPNTPPIGMRVDFWDPATSTFPANSSIFFYQAGTQVRPFTLMKMPSFFQIFAVCLLLLKALFQCESPSIRTQIVKQVWSALKGSIKQSCIWRPVSEYTWVCCAQKNMTCSTLTWIFGLLFFPDMHLEVENPFPCVWQRMLFCSRATKFLPFMAQRRMCRPQISTTSTWRISFSIPETLTTTHQPAGMGSCP